MRDRLLKHLFWVYLLLLVPVAWLATKFDPYQIDGDAVSFMDIADLMRKHQWAGVVNAYWNPLYAACLAIAQSVFHTTRWNELGAYYIVNYILFFCCLAAVILFVDSLVDLRSRMWPDAMSPLLTKNAMRFFAVALVVIGATRELSMGKVRSDTLLEILLLMAFAMVMRTLASESFVYAGLMGLFFGLAYLTKSFAFVVALLSITVMVLFAWFIQSKKPVRTLVSGVTALLVFLVVSLPYVSALSKQKHRLTFGDSGALNYAWFVSGTEKFHLEPWMTDRFGSATVTLHHPEKQLLAHPGVYSYAAQPYGSDPYWFDPSYFDDQIQPKLSLSRLWVRDSRNVVLVVRYVFNHPEASELLFLLLLVGASIGSGSLRRESFWLPMLTIGVAMWLIYGMVNVEERYVTMAYLAVVLPLFAMLRVRNADEAALTQRRTLAGGMIVLLALVAAGEMLRISLEQRRLESLGHVHNGWANSPMYAVARGLQSVGVQPGDSIACMGGDACTLDPYWARIAGARITDEVFNPDHATLFAEWSALPNRDEVIHILQGQNDKVLVASFNPVEVTTDLPQDHGWIRLHGTNFYVLPITLHATAPPKTTAPAWSSVETTAP